MLFFQTELFREFVRCAAILRSDNMDLLVAERFRTAAIDFAFDNKFRDVPFGQGGTSAL